jgi:hypothetical protein
MQRMSRHPARVSSPEQGQLLSKSVAEKSRIAETRAVFQGKSATELHLKSPPVESHRIT